MIRVQYQLPVKIQAEKDDDLFGTEYTSAYGEGIPGVPKYTIIDYKIISN
jgi:hypothetical protein